MDYNLKNSFKNLRIWQKGMDLVDEIYSLCENIPWKDNKALYSQLTAAAVSVPSNIAEGQRRFSNKEFIHHLRFSLGSAAEVETQIIICRRRNYITQEELDKVSSLLEEINKGLVALINSINTDPNSKP